MGTVRGIKKFVAATAITGSLVAGGGAVFVRMGGETCVRVPEGVAALSEPAYAALKADNIQIDGLLGWHYTYNPDTGEVDAMNRLWSKLMISHYGKNFGGLVESTDLEGTTLSVFFVRGPDARFNDKLVDWRDLQSAGYEIKSTSDALVSCGSSAS